MQENQMKLKGQKNEMIIKLKNYKKILIHNFSNIVIINSFSPYTANHLKKTFYLFKSYIFMWIEACLLQMQDRHNTL